MTPDRQMPFTRGLAAFFFAGSLAVPGVALAQQPTPAQADAIRSACRSDFMANCSGVTPGGADALACLQRNAAKASPGCQQALGAVRASGAPAGQAAAASAPAAANARSASPATSPLVPDGPGRWPHTVTGANGTATIYQPQVVSWPERRTLNTRIAMGLTPTGDKAATLGVIEVAFATQTDLPERTVVLSDARLVSAKFPSADPARQAQFETRIREALATLGEKRVPLAMVIASLGEQDKPRASAVDNTPPRIFASARPASLVVFDGEPVWAPVQGSSLTYAVNTNWDVFRDGATGTLYLLNNGGWLMASDAKGPWMPAGMLPPVFGALPNDANFADVKQAIPGRAFTPQTVPTIFVSTTPAAIIVTSGPPQYTAIAGTSLSYVANTDAALFRDKAGTFYYLVSGRWFSARTLDGPWTFATASLPADFQRIPANGPRGFVLASVPGTRQAEEALIEAQIPQQATLSRASAQVNVVYAGEPRFAPIPGTTLAYATNTSFQVVQVGNAYYACYQGAWFTSTVATGPWSLTPTVPEVVYTIPPSSPLYPCTYVRVYASTATTVTYGYTAGYTMGFVSAGVLVYGTGYYYPPYIYPGPIPIYYPYPYSYAGATYYNSTTGAWAHGGAIYGPYGGARAGTAYNPNTGAWAQGGSIYGPYGGAGAFSAYNPSNGSYARGSAAYGPNGAAGNASWYNANTGRSGSTQQNANAYGRWGSSTISGPNQTVHTQSQSNAQGSAGSFSSSSGAKGAGVSGSGGNRAGGVQTSGGDVYAGADGNVYKKTDSGWQKYDNGSWNTVQQPQRNSQSTTSTQSREQGTAAQSRSGSTQAQPGAASARQGSYGGSQERSSEGFSQLEQDRSARMAGGARQQQFEGMRGGFGGAATGRAAGGFGGGRGGFHR